MELRVLGPMEVVVDSHPIELGTRMHRAVLSLLVMELDRVVSVDRLTDCLWGDEPPPTATNALQVYVSGLRKILDPQRAPGAASQILVTQSPGYVLRVPPNAIDAVRFEALTAEGQSLLGAERPAAAYDVLGLGLNLWRGSAYQDLEFESFLQPEIARLSELRATAAEARAEALLALGRHTEAVLDIDRLVSEDPLRERRWGLLALALYRAGRQGDALRALHGARQTLGEQLGVDLGPDLCRLERDILDHRPTLDWRPPVEQPATAMRRVPLRHANGGGMLALFPKSAPLARRWSKTSPVRAPGERPFGFSAADMTSAVAPFAISGSDPALYPDTPFQILYAADVDLEMAGGGVLATGRQLFTVAAGTEFFVQLLGLDDIPPTVGEYPQTSSEAIPYLFDPAHNGARDFEVIIDGASTAIGPDYLVGPVPVAGREGAHTLALAAFIRALSPGAHTVVIRGGLFGRAHAETFGIAFIQEEFTYVVEVLPAD